MKTNKNLLVTVMAISLMIPVISLAGSGSKNEGSGSKHKGSASKHEGSAGKHEDSAGCDVQKMKNCHNMCPVLISGVDVKVKKLKNGATITITSKDKETIKKIQEQAQSKLDMKNQMDKQKFTCPVMGTKMKRSEIFETAEYKGKTYNFCCKHCKPAFLKNPEKYVKE